MRALVLTLLSFALLTACSQETTSEGICNTNVVMEDGNVVGAERIYVSGDKFSQGFSVAAPITISKIMMKIIIMQNTDYKITLLQNYPRVGINETGLGQISATQTTPPVNANLEPRWFDLPSPVSLEPGHQYFIAYEIGGGQTRVEYGAIDQGSLVRDQYFELQSPSSLWTFGERTNGIAIGIAGKLGACE